MTDPRWCACRLAALACDGGPCRRCVRLALFGELVWLNGYNRIEAPGRFLNGLNAIADLLIDGARERHEARRELNEAIQDGSRDARDAYQDGAWDQMERDR